VTLSRRDFLLSGGAVMAAGCSARLFGPRQTETVRQLTVLYTNDEHGWMEPYQETAGAAGVARLWRERENVTAEGPFLVLSGGDMWTGPALSTALAGESMADVMNAMGYQAAALGNHDFDFGLQALRARRAQSAFPFLSANLRDRQTGEIPDFAVPFLIREVNGIRVGVIGLTTTETAVDTRPEVVSGLRFLPYKDVLPQTIDRLDLLHQSPGEIRGVPTGFTLLDRKTTGLQAGDLVVIAGRPSMGKTTLAVNIAENAAIAKGVPSAIFSMEMSAEQLTLRLISSLGRVNQTHLRTGHFSEEDWSRIQGAMAQLSGAPLYVDETPALTPTEVRARARRLKRERGLGLLVVDYLQLMQVPGTKENRATEISEISRSLKALAKELQVPVVALSQLNRAVEQRTDKRPVMSDLRESGAIEQDSDLILLIYREEVYDANTARKGIADIIIAKQRNGPIGEVQLTFRGEFTRFENYVAESYGEGVF